MACADEVFHFPASPSERPPGFRLSAIDAFRLANRVDAVQGAGRDGRLSAAAAYDQHDHWVVDFDRSGKTLVEVVLDGRSGTVRHIWTGAFAQEPLMRGKDGPVGQRFAAQPLVLALLTIAFLAPFFGLRPFRPPPWELILLAAFVVPFVAYLERRLVLATIGDTLLLVLLAARLAHRGARNAPAVTSRLWPTNRALAAGALLLLVGHVVVNVADPQTSDIGFASYTGADRILHGLALYGQSVHHYDTYGPVTYFAYVPFAALWPPNGLAHASPVPIHVAALLFDAATALALYAAPRILGTGPDGRRAGLIAAYAWLACPFTLLGTAINVNDALLALLTLVGLVALRRPVVGGALMGAAGLTKFAPLLLAPLATRRAGLGRPRDLALFAIAFAVVAAAVTLPLLPNGGIREIYQSTIGYQAGRSAPLAIWHWVNLPLLRSIGRGVLLAGAVVLIVVASRAGDGAAFALGAAVLTAVQALLGYWFFTYLMWILPLILIAIVIPNKRGSGAAANHEGLKRPRASRARAAAT